MTIWGKILGGAAGFAVGGPLGMIIGAAAGHAVDRMYKDKPAEGGSEEGPRQDGTKQIAFTIGVIRPPSVESESVHRIDKIVPVA